MLKKLGDFTIVNERDHYEAYIHGLFYCSCDTMGELLDELGKYEDGLI